MAGGRLPPWKSIGVPKESAGSAQATSKTRANVGVVVLVVTIRPLFKSRVLAIAYRDSHSVPLLANVVKERLLGR